MKSADTGCALAMAERDRHTGQLDAKREDFIVQSINEFVTELTEAEMTPLSGPRTRGRRASSAFRHTTRRMRLPRRCVRIF